MAWILASVIAGCAGGLVAHVYRTGGIALPTWVGGSRLLRLGVLRDLVVVGGAAPAAVYFATAAAGSQPSVETAVFFGLLAGFAGGPVLEKLAADRLEARIGGAISAQKQMAEEVDSIREVTGSGGGGGGSGDADAPSGAG